MNMPDPQAIANAWMSQISDPGQWQSWFSMARPPRPMPLAAMLQDAGAAVKPEALEQLKTDYLANSACLWQEFMAGKSPEVKDRRFSSAAWQGNPMSSPLMPHHTC
jgi:polyhydroxyalkanoate synthase